VNYIKVTKFGFLLLSIVADEMVFRSHKAALLALFILIIGGPKLAKKSNMLKEPIIMV